MIIVWIAHAARESDHVTDNELRREKLDIALVSYGILYHRKLVFDMTDFM